MHSLLLRVVLTGLLFLLFFTYLSMMLTALGKPVHYSRHQLRNYRGSKTITMMTTRRWWRQWRK